MMQLPDEKKMQKMIDYDVTIQLSFFFFCLRITIGVIRKWESVPSRFSLRPLHLHKDIRTFS